MTKINDYSFYVSNAYLIGFIIVSLLSLFILGEYFFYQKKLKKLTIKNNTKS